jgi:acetyl esterase/lipase
MNLQIDPVIDEHISLCVQKASANAPSSVGDVHAIRQFVESVQVCQASLLPAVDDVQSTDYTTTTGDNGSLSLRWYTSRESGSAKSPAVLYIHGGGMISSSVAIYDKVVSYYASMTSIPFLSVDYRLAPESPYPAAVEDCYAALSWLHQNTDELGVDPDRIAVMGDSAGGGLAACVSQLALLKGGPPIAKQVLIYPMLDDRNTTEDSDLSRFATWPYAYNVAAWDAVLGAQCGKENIPPTAAAARMVDASGMPELYLDVGELDIFRDENIEYARKHMRAGISTELHVYPAVPHAWEMFCPDADVSKRAWRDRVSAICRIGRRPG